jgi:hypothetical protein
MSLRPLLALLLLVVPGTLLPGDAWATPLGNQLSKRAQLRYQDVLTTRDGSRWRGKIVERGDVFRIRLEDNSEVAVPKEQVASVTRELHPGFPHSGQWDARAAAGFEVGIMAATQNGGTQFGPLVELGLGRNFGGAFEPELEIVLSPLGSGAYPTNPQVAVGSRYYLQPYKRAKPFTTTQFVVTGWHNDLGLRAGGGFLFDLSPNIGVGISQGVTLIIQDDDVQSDEGYQGAGAGYHGLIQVQGRF